MTINAAMIAVHKPCFWLGHHYGATETQSKNYSAAQFLSDGGTLSCNEVNQ